MTAGQPHRAPESAPGLHLATIAHESQLWDAYLEFEDDVQNPRSYRGRIRFNQAGGEVTESVTQTTVVIIEDSYEEAVAKARSFDDRHFQAMLRSALPG